MKAGEPSRALEIHEDFTFQKREWIAERIGWVVALSIVLAAVLGLLGPGPLSSATAGADDSPVRVEHYRLVRMGEPVQLKVHLRPAGSGEQDLEINSSYMHYLNIETITPEPERQESDGEGFVRFVFKAEEAKPLTLVMHARHVEPGMREAMFRFAGQSIRYKQFVFP